MLRGLRFSLIGVLYKGMHACVIVVKTKLFHRMPVFIIGVFLILFLLRLLRTFRIDVYYTHACVFILCAIDPLIQLSAGMCCKRRTVISRAIIMRAPIEGVVNFI